MRYRMRRIMKLLDAGEEQQCLSLLENPKYLNALRALESLGYVDCTDAWGSDLPIGVSLTRSGPLYLLGRFEGWCNRIAGFVVGVATTVLSAILIQLLTH